MPVGRIYLFGKSDNIFIEDDVLYRRIWETEQTYHDEKIMTKNEFIICYNTWIKEK